MVKRTFDYEFQSSNEFFTGTNTLKSFLKYCQGKCSDESDMGIFLNETDIYFLLEVKIDSYDSELGFDQFYDGDRISNSMFNHPFMRFSSEICEPNVFVDIQTTSGVNSYSMNIRINETGFDVEHFDKDIRVDNSETLYTIAFNSNVSQVWGTIREFCKGSDVNYYIDPLDYESVKIL